jgi:AraC-like DNA-binding protein/mannose-6-phosphate isomerase-like protein (cupin superfamily)
MKPIYGKKAVGGKQMTDNRRPKAAVDCQLPSANSLPSAPSVPFLPGHTISQAHVQLSASRPVRSQRLLCQREVTPHDHEFYEIAFIQGGSGLHRTAEYVAPMRRGTVLAVPPGVTHAFPRMDNVRVTNIYYLAEWLLTDLRVLWEHDGLVPLFLAASIFRRNTPLQVPQFELNTRQFAECSRELDDIAQERERSQPSLVYLKAALLKFLIRLSRAYVEQQKSRELGFAFRREIWIALDQIEETIRQSNPLSVDELAGESGLSADHFTRLFKEATGFSPMDYFQRRRIHHACTLLLNPRNSITEVAYTLGFADAAHLSRLFLRYQGLSPRGYRKRYSKG